MTDTHRTEPPATGDEKDVLEGFLDYLREAILAKVEGLDRDALLGDHVASGTTLLGIVKHLTHVERWWFGDVVAGSQLDYPWTDEDPDADWRVEDDETIEGIVAGYHEAVAQSRAITAATDLDALLRSDGATPRSFRWVLTHMIEETGRHAGHADILRELTDGATGE
ncbi:DinB family protein [soil metagenome]